MYPIFGLQDVHQYDNLELIAKQVVEGFIVGLHKSPLHGFSVEFAEHRLYNPGEDTKHIDWKVYGKTDKLFVKRFQEETNLRCQLVIDCSSSMYFPDRKHNKLFFAVYASAVLTHILKKQRDAVGLNIFSDELNTYTHAKSSTIHHKHLFSLLEQLLETPNKNIRTSAAKCLHQIADKIHKRSLVVIFSDMLENTDNTEALFSALQHLKYNNHEVILFHTVDKQKELAFDYENRPYLFVDMETGEKVKLRAGDVKASYIKLAKKYKQELMLKCGQYKIDFVEVDINQPFNQILVPYFLKRTKMS